MPISDEEFELALSIVKTYCHDRRLEKRCTGCKLCTGTYNCIGATPMYWSPVEEIGTREEDLQTVDTREIK